MNFFLEGDSFIGKTKLIREVLVEQQVSCGGFFVRRHFAEDNSVLGFELCEAEAILANEIKSPDPSHCFIWREEDGWKKNPAVFEAYGCLLLSQAKNSSSSFFLFDEIGGIELLSVCFFTRLKSLLQQDKKNIGVFKSEHNFARQKRNQRNLEELDSLRMDLRRTICDEHGQIVVLTSENQEEVRNQLSVFLKS